jgi:hypothetical protein
MWIAVVFVCVSAFVVFLVVVYHRVPRIAGTTRSKDLHLTAMTDGAITPAITMMMAPVVPMPSTDAIDGDAIDRCYRPARYVKN